MEIRYFQIIVPLFAFLLITMQIRAFSQNKSSVFESLIISFFWIGVASVAFFPDFISKVIANFFGIKDNINAIIFFALGLLFYFQLQIYKVVKKQDNALTELTRKIALNDSEKE